MGYRLILLSFLMLFGDSSSDNSETLRKIKFCECIYQSLNMTSDERMHDGSITAIIENSEFDIEIMDSIVNVVSQDIQNSIFLSKNGNTLSIYRCLMLYQ